MLPNLAPGPADSAWSDDDCRALFRSMSEALIVLDSLGMVVEANSTAETRTGLTRAELVGHHVRRPVHLQAAGVSVPFDITAVAALADPLTKVDRRDLFVLHRDGQKTRLRVRLRGRPAAGVLLLFDDISEVTLLGREIDYRSTHDPLSGLYNPDEFEVRVRTALADAQGRQSTSVLCLIAADQFTLINDTLGHVAGDELPHELAADLRSNVSPEDTLPSRGRDEFGVLLPNRNLQSMRQMIDGFLKTTRRFRVSWHGQSHAVTLSLGAVLLDALTPHVAQPMSMADAKCCLAKDAGCDRAQFAGDDDEMAHRRARMSLVGKTSKNLDEDRFVSYFEDVAAIGPLQRPLYRELLVHMRNDDGGVLTPAPLIQAAERFSLMGTLNRWMLRNAMNGLKRVGADGVIFAVSPSAQSLGDERFLEFAPAELGRSGIDPSGLCFEVTETASVTRHSEAVRFMTRLTSHGCRFVLDGFSAGMASFSYLKNFSVNYLKIDGRFVRAMLASRADRGIVDSINRIGHEMGLKTIAEHLGILEMRAPLRQRGVAYVQGRAIACGRPFDELFEGCQ